MRKLFAFAASFAMLAFALSATIVSAATSTATILGIPTVSPSVPTPRIARGTAQTFTVTIDGSNIPSSSPVRLSISRPALGSSVAGVRFKANNLTYIDLNLSGSGSHSASAQVIVDVFNSAPVFDDVYSFDVNASLVYTPPMEEMPRTLQESATVEFFVINPSTDAGGTGGTSSSWITPATQTATTGSWASYLIKPKTIRECTYYGSSFPPVSNVPANTTYCLPTINTADISFPANVTPSRYGQLTSLIQLKASQAGTYKITTPIRMLKCTNAANLATPCAEASSLNQPYESVTLVANPAYHIVPSISSNEVYAGHKISYKLMDGTTDITRTAAWSSQDPAIARMAAGTANEFLGVWANAAADRKTAIMATVNGATVTAPLTVKPMYYFVSSTKVGNGNGMLYVFRTLEGSVLTGASTKDEYRGKLRITISDATNTFLDNSAPKKIIRDYSVKVEPTDASAAGSYPVYAYFIPAQQ